MTKQKKIKLGFVPLSDCAPLIMAQELDLFRKYDLDVVLSREVGWASVRDKVVYGELDAAHALGPLAFTASLGLGTTPADCLTGLVLNLNGNAITLSNELWTRGVRDARSLNDEIVRNRGQKTFTFGVVFPFSSHNFILREWLAAAGIHPDRDVRIVIVPPASMAANLKAGNLDGFSVGEPWNSIAIQSRAGWCAATTSQLAPFHPEKVLLVRRQFSEARHEEHIRLIAALLEACAYCDRPENHEMIVNTIGQARFLNVPPDCLRPGFSGAFGFGPDRTERLPDIMVFSRHDANEPSIDKAAWIINHLIRSGIMKSPARLHPSHARNHFRVDLYEEARRLVDSSGSALAANETILAPG
ncbi:MAG: ABC transporter substrate-binding protein [Opitutaceae bacterium]|nr:ABC transporter substrate-binding protein [Verrucomicrobiales bacterium]